MCLIAINAHKYRIYEYDPGRFTYKKTCWTLICLATLKGANVRNSYNLFCLISLLKLPQLTVSSIDFCKR